MSAERVDAPHSGLAHVRKWLGRIPEKVAELRLVVVEGDDTVILERWPRKAIRPAIAPQVLDSIDAHAVAREVDVAASLVFADAEGAKIVERAVRRRFKGEVAAHAGTASDLVKQTQSHLERMTGVFLRGMETMFAQAKQSAEANAILAKQALDRVEEATRESRELRRELARTQRALGLAEEEEGGGEQGKALDLIMRLAPLVSPQAAQAAQAVGAVAKEVGE